MLQYRRQPILRVVKILYLAGSVENHDCTCDISHISFLITFIVRKTITTLVVNHLAWTVSEQKRFDFGQPGMVPSLPILHYCFGCYVG
mmetsp:Transcript_25026/g.59490  ORF Transcript_25026/g.59490 Transcript_25026/m.59490 type:complete len:88 (-) Transcript_25026:1469-1732(-)